MLNNNGYRIREYIDKGKFVVNLGCYNGPHFLVSLFIQSEGKGWDKGIGLLYPVMSITLLENMKIWCNIQVMKYRFKP